MNIENHNGVIVLDKINKLNGDINDRLQFIDYSIVWSGDTSMKIPYNYDVASGSICKQIDERLWLIGQVLTSVYTGTTNYWAMCFTTAEIKIIDPHRFNGHHGPVPEIVFGDNFLVQTQYTVGVSSTRAYGLDMDFVSKNINEAEIVWYPDYNYNYDFISGMTITYSGGTLSTGNTWGIHTPDSFESSGFKLFNPNNTDIYFISSTYPSPFNFIYGIITSGHTISYSTITANRSMFRLNHFQQVNDQGSYVFWYASQNQWYRCDSGNTLVAISNVFSNQSYMAESYNRPVYNFVSGGTVAQTIWEHITIGSTIVEITVTNPLTSPSTTNGSPYVISELGTQVIRNNSGDVIMLTDAGHISKLNWLSSSGYTTMNTSKYNAVEKVSIVPSALNVTNYCLCNEWLNIGTFYGFIYSYGERLAIVDFNV